MDPEDEIGLDGALVEDKVKADFTERELREEVDAGLTLADVALEDEAKGFI